MIWIRLYFVQLVWLLVELLLRDVVTLIMKKLEWVLVIHSSSWKDDLGKEVNWPKYLVLSYDLILNCEVVIVLDLLSCWLLTYDDV